MVAIGSTVIRSSTFAPSKGPATDHYRLLQVRRDASTEVIAAAYRRLIKDAHPDAGGDGEAARALNRAHEVLSDPGSRRRYDMTLPPESGYPSLSGAVAHRVGVSIGRHLGRWNRSVRLARRDLSPRD